MSWQEPKTDWGAGDIPGPDDFNRIEGNISLLKHGKKIISESETIVIPAPMIWITGAAGGGGGNGFDTTGTAHRGGDGGRIFRYYLCDLPVGELVHVTIGDGGTGAAKANAGNGGDTIFGEYLTLSGGKGAIWGNPTGKDGDSGTVVNPLQYLLAAGEIVVGYPFGKGGAGGASRGENGEKGILIMEY